VIYSEEMMNDDINVKKFNKYITLQIYHFTKV